MFQPATVSRCGMIYLEPTTLGWRPIMKSWIHQLPPVLTKDNSELIVDLFEWLVDPCLRFVHKNCKVCIKLIFKIPAWCSFIPSFLSTVLILFKGKGLRFIVLYHICTFHTTLQFTSYPP